MNTHRIAVLRGGPSEEYDISLITGAAVLEALRDRGSNVIDVVITREGEWIIDGRVRYPENVLPTFDVVFLALHGTYGEDGTIQKLLDRYGVRYTGSDAYTSHRAMHKAITKDTLRDKVPMAPHVLLSQSARGHGHRQASMIGDSFGPEYVIKPVSSGSSVGTMMVGNVAMLPKAIEDALENYNEVLVEKRVRGTEATVGVIDNFRDQSTYVLPAVEIIPSSDYDFFDRQAKYNDTTLERCPAQLPREITQSLEQYARLVHHELGLRDYSRSDFMIDESGNIYFLEVNTLPGLTPSSLMPKAVDAVGCTYGDFLEHLIVQALGRSNR